MNELNNNTDFVKFPVCTRIITQGDPSECAYMIISGEVRVFVEEGSRKIELATLGKDQIFGEGSIISGAPYGANVEAIEECELMIITPESLNEMLEESNPIIKAMTSMLIERLKNTNESLIKSESREFMDIVLI